MTGWTDINLAELSTVSTPVAEGEYTLEILPGAKYSDFDPAKVEVCAAVVDGESAGRKLFFSYPDPAKQDWSPRVFKRLVETLGMDIEAGESPVAYLNRAAGLRFKSNVKHRKSNEEGAPPKADVDIFKVRPAA